MLTDSDSFLVFSHMFLLRPVDRVGSGGSPQLVTWIIPKADDCMQVR